MWTVSLGPASSARQRPNRSSRRPPSARQQPVHSRGWPRPCAALLPQSQGPPLSSGSARGKRAGRRPRRRATLAPDLSLARFRFRCVPVRAFVGDLSPLHLAWPYLPPIEPPPVSWRSAHSSLRPSLVPALPFPLGQSPSPLSVRLSLH